jgi:hypothetical protein
MKTWWVGNAKVEKVMTPVAEVISRHIKRDDPAWNDIYNRAYEAVFIALKQNNVPMESVNNFDMGQIYQDMVFREESE